MDSRRENCTTETTLIRVVHAIQLADEVRVIQKKSNQGVRTPKREIAVVEDRLKGLKEAFG